jgi:hypothetical protein
MVTQVRPTWARAQRRALSIVPVLLLLLSLLPLASLTAQAAVPDQAAAQRAVAWLRGQQNADGSRHSGVRETPAQRRTQCWHLPPPESIQPLSCPATASALPATWSHTPPR